MSQYSIKDLEKLSGIQAHTIRMWEKRYQLIEPHRTTTNIRYYDDEHLKRVLNVSVLVRAGKKIGWVSSLDDQNLNRELLALYGEPQSSASTEADVNGLIVSMMELDEKRFEEIYNARLKSDGFFNVVVNLFYPFLNKVGILWGINEINPAQEHFISNLVRQKMIVAIDSLGPSKESDVRVLFFLPDGELHEIGLMLSHFIAKERGLKCVYLGQSVPTEDIKRVQEIFAATHAVTFLTAVNSKEEVESTLGAIQSALGTCSLMVSGYASVFEGVTLPSDVQRIVSVDSYLAAINRLSKK